MSYYVNPELLELCRETSERAMDKTVVVKRRSAGTPDTTGGHTYTWSTVSTTVAEIAPLRGSDVEAVISDQMRGRNMWWFELPHDADVRLTDRLEVDGVTYEVGYVADPESYEVMQRVVVTRLE